MIVIVHSDHIVAQDLAETLRDRGVSDVSLARILPEILSGAQMLVAEVPDDPAVMARLIEISVSGLPIFLICDTAGPPASLMGLPFGQEPFEPNAVARRIKAILDGAGQSRSAVPPEMH